MLMKPSTDFVFKKIFGTKEVTTNEELTDIEEIHFIRYL